MIGLLTSRFGLAGIVGIGLVIMYLAWSIQVAGLRSDLAGEQSKVAIAVQRASAAETALANVRAEVSLAVADAATARAEAAETLSEQRDQMQRQIDTLRSVSALAERRRTEASNMLIADLVRVPPADTSPLSDAAKSYLAQVRAQQMAMP
jgi:hypothetical protein